MLEELKVSIIVFDNENARRRKWSLKNIMLIIKLI
jgi:hypothetical protein